MCILHRCAAAVGRNASVGVTVLPEMASVTILPQPDRLSPLRAVTPADRPEWERYLFPKSAKIRRKSGAKTPTGHHLKKLRKSLIINMRTSAETLSNSRSPSAALSINDLRGEPFDFSPLFGYFGTLAGSGPVFALFCGGDTLKCV